MPRFKEANYLQGKFVPILFERQILPGSFEYALNHIVDHNLNCSVFNPFYNNEEQGAPAYDPRILLKIVLYAYSKGIISSRQIARLCEENVMFMALSADTRPHFTTIANFIASGSEPVASLFRDVLLYCDELGLIGKEMFAIDGCKISSNASKEWSGTREDFEKKKQHFEKSIRYLLEKHQTIDKEQPAIVKDKEDQALENLKSKVAKIDSWLKDHPQDKTGSSGRSLKQNLTDPESAKMVSSHGVVQGYNGLATVDSKHQIVVQAEAFGDGSDSHLLQPAIKDLQSSFNELGQPLSGKTILTADSGFHSEDNMKFLSESGIDAYVADHGFRKRDPRFQSAHRHRQPIDRYKGKLKRKKFFTASDFILNPETGKLLCPAGKELYVKDRNYKNQNGFMGIAYKAKVTDCRVCAMRANCLRLPHTPARQVHKFETRVAPETFTQKMIRKMDTAAGRFLYSMRMGIVEPVFADIRSTLGLDRFTMRGKRKVNAQWKLYAMVHNLLKIHRYAPLPIAAT